MRPEGEMTGTRIDVINVSSRLYLAYELSRLVLVNLLTVLVSPVNSSQLL